MKNNFCCEWQEKQGTLTITIEGKCICGYQYPISGVDNYKKIYCGGDHCSGFWNLPCSDEKHPKIAK